MSHEEVATRRLASIIDLASWDGRASVLSADYRNACPFPHSVIDDVVRPDVLEEAIGAFDGPLGADWTRYFHFNPRKFGNNDPSTWRAPLPSILEAFSSRPWIERIERLTGIEGLLADPTLDGAGLHVTRPGGQLNVHTDFTTHHSRPTWQRRVNLLLYLNDGWQPGDGGDLQFWSTDMQRCERSIEPLANRLVVFTTSGTSFHGHPVPLAATARPRRSLAVYYYTEGATATRATTYYPLPGTTWRTSTGVRADNVALKVYDAMKRRRVVSDRAITRLLAAASVLRRGHRDVD